MGWQDFSYWPPPSDDLIALWQGLSNSGVDLWYSIYDREHKVWSLPKQLTDDRTVVDDYSSVVNSACQAMVVYSGREIVTGFQTVLGESVAYPELENKAELFQVESDAATTIDLTVADLVVMPPNPSPGSTAHVSGTLINSGNLTVEPAFSVFRDNGSDVSHFFDDGPLAAGDRRTFTFEWDVEDTGAPHTLSFLADPEDVISETNEINNVITATTVLPDLQLAWRASGFSTDTITIAAGIRNAGVIVSPSPFWVELRAGSETGSSYASAQINTDLANDAVISVTFVLSDVGAVPANATTTWAVVDADGDVIEADEENNAGLVDVPRWPDLTFSLYDLVGAPTQRLAIRNQGPVAASNARVAVYQGVPGGDLLFETTVPNLMPGGVAEMPIRGPAGDLALVVRVDPANEIVEGDESNNLLERLVTFWPRLFLPLVFRDH